MEVKKVAQAIGRFSPELKPYVLEDVIEEKKDIDKYRHGSDAVVLDLDLKCVGKLLHPVFFEKGNTEAGMEKILEKFFKEIKLLSKMNHPNIVRFLGIYYKQDPSLSMELPVLVMEKMKFSLTEYLSTNEKGSIPKDKALNILLGVSKGLVYLHEEMKVAHRDLSSNNILLAADLSAKIADLGSARVLDKPGGWNSVVKLTRKPGTLDFMPPEALEDPPQYTVSVDVFSFGCVIIHLCTHKWPEPTCLSKIEKNISEIERREKYIVEMTDSYLLPMVLQCLAEKGPHRPASADLMSSLQAKLEEKQPDYTIVFAGITGTGKSTAGNFFFKKEVFSSGGGLLSVTAKCSAYTSTICGKTVKIIDTPGFFDGSISGENFEELSKTLTHSKDGIHAVVFVMNNNRYTEQCEKAIKQLLVFKGLKPFLFLLLTHANNEGETKATTDEYIQQILSSSRCPDGLKDLIGLVKNRVIMLESTNTVVHYHAEKSAEFIMMMEEMQKSNAHKVYTNPMLQHAAQVYEKVKLQQQAEIRIATKVLQSNEEKIQQLKIQQADSVGLEVGEVIKRMSDELGALLENNEHLELALKEITDEDYLERVTNEILQDEMERSEITTTNMIQFIVQYARQAQELGYLIDIQRLFTYQNMGEAIGGIVGRTIGALVGSVVPWAGTSAGAHTGAQIGAAIGEAVGDFDCKQQ